MFSEKVEAAYEGIYRGVRDRLDQSTKDRIREHILCFNRLHHRRYASSPRGNPNGISIFEKDWDNLLILDACRQSAFKQLIGHTGIDGDLSSRQTLGSCSPEFVQRNFADRELHDLVIVSANLWYHKIQQSGGDDEYSTDLDVHDLIIVDEYNKDDIPDSKAHKLDLKDGLWTLPEFVTKYAKRASEQYPDKRLLIHYHQPHTPYIGATGQKYHDKSKPMNVEPHALDEAYLENVALVLEEVERLLPTLEGKTAITADHADLLGEWDYPIPIRQYGHPCQTYHPKLVDVPWYVPAFDTRKPITAEPPVEYDFERDMNTVNQRLRELGYKT